MMRRGYEVLTTLALLAGLSAGICSARAQAAGGCAVCVAMGGGFADVAYAIEHGADVNARNANGESALLIAASHDDNDTALLLLANHADPNGTGNSHSTAYGRSALSFAAGAENNLLAEALLEAGADPNARDDEGGTPLMEAAAGANVQLTHALLNAHADPQRQNNNGDTALSFAVFVALVSKKDDPAALETIRVLLDAGADPNAGSETGIGFPLAQAADPAIGNKDMLALLLAHGGNAGTNQPLLLDAMAGRLDVGALLVNHGAEIDRSGYDGKSALMRAAERNDLPQVRALLALGADPDNSGSRGFPLGYAVQNKNLDMVRLLLDSGASATAIASPEGFLNQKDEIPDDAMRALLQQNFELIQTRPADLFKTLKPEVAQNILAGPEYQPPRGSVPGAVFQAALALAAQEPSIPFLQLDVVALSRGVESLPGTPAEALVYEAAGKNAYAQAKTRTDLLAAAAEYEKAARLAPWVPAFHKNLCILYLLSGAYGRAGAHCAMYEVSNPPDLADFLKQLAPFEHDVESMKAPRGEFRDRGTGSSGALPDAAVPQMVVIPPGTFQMGSPASEPGHTASEEPQHAVAIAYGFAMSKNPITNAQWKACVADHACNDVALGEDDDSPVVDLTWQDAHAYTNWLSQKTGQHYRLASEAEYEYAARAGTTTAYYWGDAVGSNHTQCDGCGSGWDNIHDAPVSSLAANAFGLFDMTGNVYEWVEDCASTGYSGAPTDGRPWWQQTCSSRVRRSCSWRSKPEECRTAYRNWVDTTSDDPKNLLLGIRVVRQLR